MSKLSNNKWETLRYSPVWRRLFVSCFGLVNVTLPLCAQDDVACVRCHTSTDSAAGFRQTHTHTLFLVKSVRGRLLCRCSSAVLSAFILKDSNSVSVTGKLNTHHNKHCNLSQTFVWRQKTSGSAPSCRRSALSFYVMICSYNVCHRGLETRFLTVFILLMSSHVLLWLLLLNSCQTEKHTYILTPPTHTHLFTKMELKQRLSSIRL